MSKIIGVYHPDPDGFLPLIREAAPDAELRVCNRAEGIEEILDDIEVLLAFKFGFERFPRNEILRAPRLKWVQLASAGIDHMCPFDPSRLTVTNGSGVHGNVMSQYVFGGLAHFMWDFPRLSRQQAEHRWERFAVRSLEGMTMGIIGLGSIGTTLARHAGCYGMRVIGTRRSGKPVEGVARVYGPEGMREVMQESDVVVVAAPLTKDTRGLVGSSELAAMRSSAYLVSISRGGIIEENALLEVLIEGRIAGALLDVFEEEPLPATSPFWDLPNVLVTPHISGELADWAGAVANLFTDNLRRYLASEPLRNIVDPDLGY